MAFYEIRQYEIRPGKMAEWVKMMDEEILPFQAARGMVISGLFRGEEDDSVYIWIRRFESEAERVRLYKAVYEDPIWLEDMSPRVGQLINRETINVQRVVPSAGSVLQ